MTFCGAHKQLSVVGEADLGRETANGNVTVPGITEETENVIEGVIGTGREKGFVTGTETEEKGADIEDNPSGASGHLKQQQQSLYFLCVFTSSNFYFQLSQVHCVEGLMTLFVPSMQ